MRYLTLAIVLLAGCATPEQRADYLMEKFGPFCDKMGYERNTDAWRGCVTQQAANRRPVTLPAKTSQTCTTTGATTTCY